MQQIAPGYEVTKNAPEAAEAAGGAGSISGFTWHDLCKLATGVYCVAIDAESEYNKPILIPGAWTYPPDANGQRTVKVIAGQANSDANFGWDYEFAP